MRNLIFYCLLALSFISNAQDESIVKIVDDLTARWDKQALQLETYSGLKYYCTADQYREKTIDLLDKIHHYDTLLYERVTTKYADSRDKEAAATLKDIITVEEDYTTANFKKFLQQECARFEEVEALSKSDGSKYYKEVEKLEKELVKYIEVITERIDNIDEHIHHLKLD